MNIFITIIVSLLVVTILFGIVDSYREYHKALARGPVSYRSETKYDKTTRKYYTLKYPLYEAMDSKVSFEGKAIRED